MDPITLLSIAGMAGSGLGMLFNKRKKFGDTEYGRKLKELSQRGINTQPIIGAIGKETGNVAQQAKVDLRGRMISQGMGGSIAGQRAITNVDVKRMDQLQKAIRDIQSENERLKTQYGLQYAQSATQYDTQGQAQQQEALSNLMGVSGSLLYNQLSAPKTRSARPEIQPTRPEVPLEAPPDYVMPNSIPTLDLPVPIKPSGMEASPLSPDFMRTSRLYGGYSNTDFPDFIKYLRYLNQRR